MQQHILIIAEIGSNYDGTLDTAREYIRSVKDAGADAVKFQTLRKSKLIAPKILSDGSWVENPVFKNFTNLELPEEWHSLLKQTADEVGIEFLSTPFYVEAVDLLERVGVQTYKIASGDITFTPMLQAVGKTGKKIILSTGGSSLPDIDQALSILKRAGSGEIALLHCVSNYPPLWEEMNLNVITTLRNTFKLPVGISDHTPGYTIPIAAIALGATVIEKHVTFDRSLPGPDHPFAMTMDEFAELVRQVRSIESALGTGIKKPTDSEQAKQHRMRRGVYNPDTLEATDGNSGIWLRPEHPMTQSKKP